MKKIIPFIIGGLFYILLSILLSSYGNRIAHKNFNEYVVERFDKVFINSITKLEKFKNYVFMWDRQSELPGMAVTAGGLEIIKTKEVEKNAKDWIIHGGYSADEPELPASFRHFYDPTEPSGERYLKDHLDLLETILPDFIFFNPRIDQIEWAIAHSDHEYNWNNGKEHIRLAMSNPDPEQKEEHMAFAFRALGETLHLIADMGCPAHVRDDSHPSPFGTKGVRKYFGSPDPYEEIFEKLTHRFSEFSQGAVDEKLTKKCREASKIEDVAVAMAEYTNQNFFTEQTIKGDYVTQKIHLNKVYPTPHLDNMTYDPTTFYYSTKISGHDVLMCKDLYFTWFNYKKQGYPYLDCWCVESQAKVLVPQILEAGANALRLFFPEIEIVVDGYENQVIKGRVIHKTDGEYLTGTDYNGPVQFIHSTSLGLLGEIVCVDGKFESVLDLSGQSFDPEKDQVKAQIELGDMLVYSKPFSANEISGEFTMTITDWDSGALIEEEVERCAATKVMLSFPPGTDDSYYYSIEFGNGDVYTDSWIRDNPTILQVVYSIPETYHITAMFKDNNKDLLNEVEGEIIVKRNDFLHGLTPMKKISIDMGFASYYKFEDGEGHWAGFDFAYGFADGPEAELTWSGRSFDFHRQGDEREINISGTLSEDCWSIKTLHATFEIKDDYTSELTISELPLIESFSAPCPKQMPETYYQYNCTEPEDYITSMSARAKRSKDNWVSYSSVDWSKVGLAVKFSK